PVVAAHEQVALPVTGHGPILDLGRSLADEDHVPERAGGLVPAGSTSGAAGPEAGRELSPECPPALHEERLIDRLVAHPHLRIGGPRARGRASPPASPRTRHTVTRSRPSALAMSTWRSPVRARRRISSRSALTMLPRPGLRPIEPSSRQSLERSVAMVAGDHPTGCASDAVGATCGVRASNSRTTGPTGCPNRR